MTLHSGTTTIAIAAPKRPAIPPDLSQAGAFMLGDPARGSQPDLFGRLSPTERALVTARGRRRGFQRGEAVFNQGHQHDGIFLIEEGLVRVFYTAASGREITLAYWLAGNFVGGPEIFGSGINVWSGTAARDTTGILLAGAELRALVERIPALSMGIIEGLIFKGSCYSLLAQMLGTLSVGERLVMVLQRLTRMYGVATGEGIAIATPFTHDDLAHMVGATRQWVSMTFRRLAEQGILRVRRGQILVLRPDWLDEHESLE
jgi:CRP-like cAMP-binding protein